MKTYHKNPRTITARQFEDLRSSLERLGDLSGIVHDLNSDEVIGGNQRSRVFDGAAEIQIVETFEQPDEQGTVAHGFLVWEGKKYAYRQVRWTPEQCEEANIRANKAGGSWDFDTLANEFNHDDLLLWGFEGSELGFQTSDDDEIYTRKIDAPIYRVTSSKPDLSSLYDPSAAEKLIEEIKAAGIDEELEKFLIEAAHRHTRINFKRCAEFYAHSDPAIQRLFENNALVIIDFNRAIELGYVQLSEAVISQYVSERGGRQDEA